MESDAAELHRTQPQGYLIGFPFGRRTSFLHSSLFVPHLDSSLFTLRSSLNKHHSYIFCSLGTIDEGLLYVGSLGRTGDERAKAIEGSLGLILDA